LLIDEVDVFFSDKFYGKTYNPLTILKNADIRNVIEQIWANRQCNKQGILNEIKTLPSYLNMMQIYSNVKNLITDNIDRMIDKLYLFLEAVQKNTENYIV
jgi:hypothetical protein